MNNKRNFEKYVVSNNNISSNNFEKYKSKFNTYMNLTPNIVEERNLNVAIMDVFSRLMMNRIIYLMGEIDDFTSSIITAQLFYLDSEDDSDITFYINSPGGNVYDGNGILDAMDYIKSDIKTVNYGLAASMAAVILSNGTKGKRKALKRSRTMIHQPLGSSFGQATDIEIANKEIQLLKQELIETLSNNTNNSIKKIKKDINRDMWMTSTEALDYGIIDEIVKRDKK